MNIFSKKYKKVIAIILFSVLLFGVILGPARQARAIIPVFDVTNSPAHFNTSVMQTALTNFIIGKEGALDPLGNMIAKFIIRTLRDMMLQWIITGQFGLPSFVTSFMVDPHKMAENAARLFASRITGIDFCNFNVRPPDKMTINIRLNFALKCNVRDFRQFIDNTANILGYSQAGNPGNPNLTSAAVIALWVDEFLVINNIDDPLYGVYKAAKLKQEHEKVALKSFFDEMLGTGGFIGQRDEVTGKINTPGTVIGGYVKEAVSSSFGEGIAADEIGEAIVAIIDTLVGRFIQQGLNSIFAP